MEKNSAEIDISVIIPMFNVEKVIDRCLHSIATQKMERVEYLFIDDCSIDATVSKLAGWIEARKESTSVFRLIRHQSNQGVAAARNTGLEHAIGKYIYYIDADDYIEPDTLQTLFENAEENELDISGCEWFLSFCQNERYMTQPDVENGEELFCRMAQGMMRWNLWLFLVRRMLYEDNKIRFMSGINMGEDMMVMLKLSLNAHKVGICHRPFYHYMQTNAESLTKNYQKSIFQITANIEEVERYLAVTGKMEMSEYINLLKLNVKLPFLISSNTGDYEIWLNWFPEANKYIEKNPGCSLYTMIIQKAARARRFWILRLYYWVVIKVVYGFVYK